MCTSVCLLHVSTRRCIATDARALHSLCISINWGSASQDTFNSTDNCQGDLKPPSRAEWFLDPLSLCWWYNSLAERSQHQWSINASHELHDVLYVITLALRHPLSMGLSVGGACLHSGFHLCFRLILSSQPFPRGLQFSSTYGVINNERRRMELTMASWTMSNPESQMVVKSRAKIIQVVKTLTTDLKVVTYTSSWPKSKHTTAASSDFLW